METNRICDDFGSMVFNEAVMKEHLPKNIYRSLKKTIDEGIRLDSEIAEVIASAMKDWAIDRGATHYSHWFIPMTGLTAEKHDSFISLDQDGKVIMEFSGKNLIKGESDASSFPSGGLRATFEARGYTTWDCTSPAFVKGNTLFIPTAFCSYNGEALDKKTPLLRSMDAISKSAMRFLNLFGDTAIKKVFPSVGPEQEYFLIDKSFYDKRLDLILCGRTLFGAKPPKGQELEDHYYGNLKERVEKFMKELDCELWKLGITAKTKHNEAAPAQHELTPIFSIVNVASDHNHLTMEIMKKVANHHGLVCLIHEKPFAGVNGSGKHNNWSLTADKGENLLDPTRKPAENMRFLLMLTAVIYAVDRYSSLLSLSTASAGNEHRLGGNEAPPPIISMFLGTELSEILENIKNGHKNENCHRVQLESGVSRQAMFSKDKTDRNRTSPFAFTGNKFEFRMVGASQSVADSSTMLNGIIAEGLDVVSDMLEKGDAPEAIIKKIMTDHDRIIFNGNNYSQEWADEANARGLLNIKNTVEAIPYILDPENIAVLTKHGIYTEQELHSRYEILFETYIKTINIESLTMLDMAKKSLYPATVKYISLLSKAYLDAKATQLGLDLFSLEQPIRKFSALSNDFLAAILALEKAHGRATRMNGEIIELAKAYRDKVYVEMDNLRSKADALEEIMDMDLYPFPSYADLLYRV